MANIDSSFNEFCYERKKTNGKHLERNLGSRECHKDLQCVVVFCLVLWFFLLLLFV